MKSSGVIRESINRKILNLCLRIIRRHVEKQEGIVIYKYDRERGDLSPLIWRARSISKTGAETKQATNEWVAKVSAFNLADKIVLDVGANHGGTASKLSRAASIVYAFEPERRNFKNLQDQIAIRKLDNVVALQLAVGNRSGTVDFYERESHGIHSLGKHNKGKIIAISKVSAVTIDGFCSDHKIDQVGLLKIDVEGFENEVLEGAKGLLERRAIGAVIFEFSPKIHKARGIDTYAPIRTLQVHNYGVYDVLGEEITEQRLLELDLCDLFAFPDEGSRDVVSQLKSLRHGMA